MSNLPFTHLHLHTEYSLLDGANKIGELAHRLKELGYGACAITDHGVMFGAIDFYKTLSKQGLKPIIGMEAYIHNSDDIGDKSSKQRFHVCLLAKNEIGYKNLMYLASMAQLEGFYYYPRINKKLLFERSEGLICTSACLQGEVNWHLNVKREKNVQFGAGGFERAKEIALEYKAAFGDDFYLELMRHGIEEQQFIDNFIIRLSIEAGIKIIATNDTHYKLPDDSEPHEAFMCIAMNKQYDDPNRMRHSVHEFYIKSAEQIEAIYADIPEALLNTQEIVDKCDLKLSLGSPVPPRFKFTSEFKNEVGAAFGCDDELFEHQCRVGLEKRLQQLSRAEPQSYHERLEVEMQIIKNMKFSGYMLIVWDFVREAKEMGIPVGPGRGSAAGSLVAYSLGITDIDPLPYNLLFERFLNPERVSMPDIDMDFCQDRRGEIIEYVTQKYGRNNVAQVITFGSLLAKGVIRDVARVLGFSYETGDRLAKLIPEKLGINLKEAYELEPKIKEEIDKDPKLERVWEFALSLEGLKRNAGMHAAGVVISNEELWHSCPLYRPTNGDESSVTTQYSLNFLEDVGLIKFDFLGLKTLTVIHNAVKLIRQHTGTKLELSSMAMNDAKVYEMMSSGHTLGLFQIESGGMQSLVSRLMPTCFEDIIAILALYRPGPMESGMLDDFIERKHGRQKIVYMFPQLEPILAPTYGVIVYQEQVMQIVQSIGGFSLGEADIVRRAMGKKDIKYMLEKKEQFAEGAAKQGLDAEKAKELFDLIEKFAGYGFNKSHSAAYAMVTYQTAYLKTYYQTAFMTALLSSERDNTDKIVVYIDELKKLGINLLPPSIFKSSVDFTPTVTKDGAEAILFGLGAIKGVGEAALNCFIEARQETQFESLADFLSRIDSQKVNKKVVESLVKAGAMDGFGISRRAMLANIEGLVEYAQESAKAKKNAQESLFGEGSEIANIPLEISNMPEFALKELLEFEKECLGFYISGHPLEEYKSLLDALTYMLSSELEALADGSDAIFVGKIEERTTKISKKGNKFEVVKVMDLHGSIELTIFESHSKKLDEIDTTRPVVFYTTVNKDGQFVRIRVNDIVSADDAKDYKPQGRSFGRKNYKKDDERKAASPERPEAPRLPPAEPIIVEFPLGLGIEFLGQLKEAVAKMPGNRPLKILLSSKAQDVLMETKLFVADGFEVPSAFKEAAASL